MPKTVTLRVDDETYRSFIERAKAEQRSLSSFIETAVKRLIRETDFTDDAEMAGILANEELVRRLRKGSEQARRRKGKMIG